MRADVQLAREALLLRIGALALLAGSVLVLVFRTLHGDLPADQGGAASLAFVAAYPIYRLVHLADGLGFLFFAGGLVVLSHALAQPLARALGRLGAAIVLVGAAVHIAESSIDGFTMTSLAQAWAAAAPAARANLESGADLALAMLGGPATLSLAVVWGLTLALYGLALQQEGYPGWLAWAGLAVGIIVFLMATTQYLAPNIFPGVLLYGGGTFAAHLWAIALGVVMWRRSSTLAAAGAPARP